MRRTQKILVLSRTPEPESFVMYCAQDACGWVGETNEVRDPTCPRCSRRDLRVWKNRA